MIKQTSKILFKKIKLLFYTLLILGSLSTSAYAYLDPGSISLAVQGILAAIAGLAATYRLWIFKFKEFFSKLKPKKKDF